MKSCGFLVGRLAGDQDLVDVLGVEVADRALDEVAFLVDEARRRRLQRQVAHVLPQADLVLEVALDLLLGARGAGGADDEPHALRHLELLGDGLEALAVLRLGDLAGDAAAAAGVGHQHGVAAGQRQVGGERRALAAALLLDDLHQDDLAALDHLLDLVGAHAPARPLGHLLQRVLGADLLDRADGLGRLGLIAADLLDVAVPLPRTGASPLPCAVGAAAGRAAAARRRVAAALVRVRLASRLMRDGRRLVQARRHAQPPAAPAGARRLVGLVVASRSRASAACRRASPRRAAAGLLGFRAGIGFGLGFGLCFGLLLQQRLPVGDGDLVVVGMDFAEGQEAVAVAAVVDEGRLQRRLDARHLGQIDIAAQQLARGRFVVELLYPAVAQHHDPGFLRMRGVDKHLVAFVHVMGSLAPRRPARGRPSSGPRGDALPRCCADSGC